MKLAVTSFLVLCCSAVSAVAGPNYGGTILLHYNASAAGTDGNYSGYGGLTSCDGAVVQVPPGAGCPTGPGAFFAYAAFPTESSPRVAVITFGLQYDSTSALVCSWGKTADGELPTTVPRWPRPGSGDAVQWNVTRTSRLFEFYWFRGYAYQGQLLTLTGHPTTGGVGTFTDDAIPASTDLILDYGSLGFGIDGHRACPVPIGACCYLDWGVCEVRTQAQCIGLYTWMGPGTVCSPNPCPVTVGACCELGSCWVGHHSDCYWTWIPDVTCTPDPCSPSSGAFSLTPPVAATLRCPTPNPTTGSARIFYGTSASGRVLLVVCDVSGREASRLVDGEQTAGWHSVEWDARDASGSRLPAGAYFARLTGDGQARVQRLILVR